MHVVHIFNGGPVQRIRSACGRIWTFEMHPVCGPSVVDPRTEAPWERQPGEKSPFWAAINAWCAQGKVVDPHGLCVWSELEQPKLVHLGGRNYTLAGSTLAERAAQAKQGGAND